MPTVCSGVDEGCDGLIDDEDDSVSGAVTWYEDGDGDGLDTSSVEACEQPSGYVADGSDCDDGAA